MSGEERIGHRAGSTSDDNTEQDRVLIINNRRVTIDELEKHMHISPGSEQGIIHKRLNRVIQYLLLN